MVEGKLLLGNHAFALGALDAGVCFAAGYPGTPSSEIIEYLAKNPGPGVHVEWSVNEKVALEAASGVAYAGARALVAMKHVGFNVALDPYMTLVQTGVKGGLVILVADDPGMHSSQNEQDTRHFVRAAKGVLLEPADSQEAYDLVVEAFELSERLGIPVVVKSVTNVSHTSSPVKWGDSKSPGKGVFEKDVESLVMVPQNARPKKQRLLEKQGDIMREVEDISFNKLEARDGGKIGVVAVGSAYNLAKDYAQDAKILKCGTWPAPAEKLGRLVSSVEKIVVLEEGDPIIEQQLWCMHDNVCGKLSGHLPLYGELTPENVMPLFDMEVVNTRRVSLEIPVRPPTLCPGCPHRGTYYVLKGLDVDSTPGDIGCYSLGVQKPFEVMDTCLCMGASIGQAHGMNLCGVEKNIALIGDSTFLHSGITPLINAVYNGSDINIVIFDNHTVSMTGHQPTPLTGVRADGSTGKSVDLEQLCIACGAGYVVRYNPYNLEEVRSVFEAVAGKTGVNVLIADAPCARLDEGVKGPAHYIKESECTGCGACMELGCPAISQGDDGVIVIDEVLCTGCTLCRQVCPQDAVKRRSETG